MKIRHETRGKHFNADGCDKKTEFNQEREERRANQLETKPGLNFISPHFYDALELMPWLDKHGNPKEDETPEQMVELSGSLAKIAQQKQSEQRYGGESLLGKQK